MLTKLFVHLQNLKRDEKGQGMVEYALIIGLVAVLLIGSIVLFKDKVIALFTSLTTKLGEQGL